MIDQKKNSLIKPESSQITENQTQFVLAVLEIYFQLTARAERKKDEQSK
jgi:hypothetical protein